jgi:hypothetical protein
MVTMTDTAHLNFYGDTATHTNKLFSFKVNSENDAQAGLKRFRANGVRIRAAYFTIKVNGIIKSSTRIT